MICFKKNYENWVIYETTKEREKKLIFVYEALNNVLKLCC